MTFDELLSQSRKGRVRKRPSEVEHRIQQACVRWFNLQYPHLRGRLFAVPNGGRRDVGQGLNSRQRELWQAWPTLYCS